MLVQEEKKACSIERRYSGSGIQREAKAPVAHRVFVTHSPGMCAVPHLSFRPTWGRVKQSRSP